MGVIPKVLQASRNAHGVLGLQNMATNSSPVMAGNPSRFVPSGSRLIAPRVSPERSGSSRRQRRERGHRARVVRSALPEDRARQRLALGQASNRRRSGQVADVGVAQWFLSASTSVAARSHNIATRRMSPETFAAGTPMLLDTPTACRTRFSTNLSPALRTRQASQFTRARSRLHRVPLLRALPHLKARASIRSK